MSYPPHKVKALFVGETPARPASHAPPNSSAQELGGGLDPGPPRNSRPRSLCLVETRTSTAIVHGNLDPQGLKRIAVGDCGMPTEHSLQITLLAVAGLCEGGHMAAPVKILFVCGRNKRRSPTAGRIFRKDPRMHVRAVGLGETSPRRVTQADVEWADLILPMERKNAVRLKVMFPGVDPFPDIEILDIHDDYTFMDKKLIGVLEETVEAALAAFLEARATPTPREE